MKVKMKRFDKDLPMPEFKTKGATGMDLYTREDTTIEPKSFGYIPLNVALDIPDGMWVALLARSSTHKHGLMSGNGLGVMDSDFCGDGDEYKFIVYNTKDEPVTVEKGTRIAQIVFMKKVDVEVEEVESLGNEDRGGIGSTGQK